MEASCTQPVRFRRRHRFFGRRLLVAAFLLSGFLLGVWQWRISVVSRLIHGALERQGLSDVTFHLSQLSLGGLTVEDVRIGAADPVLTVDRLEARFSLSELRGGQLSRLRVRGVRTPVCVERNRLSSPLQQTLSRLVSSRSGRKDSRAAARDTGEPQFVIGEVSVYDVQVRMQSACGDEVLTLSGDASLVAEPDERNGGLAPARYRVWAGLRESSRVQGTLSGTVSPQTGAITLSAEMKVRPVDGLVERARLIFPDEVSRLAAVPTNCSFALRGSLSLSDWTNAGPFEATAELGRGSAFTLKKPDGWVRFQTLRLEASGTPADVQCRMSVGIAGFRVGGEIQASQEEGRLLSMRGTARYQQTATNRVVRGTLDSDLPGKSVAQVLPKVLPLLPRLLTEGGTLHADVELDQPDTGAWRGAVRYTAEARRNTLTLPAGRVGAGRVSIQGALDVRDARLGALKTDIRVEDGYFFRPGVSVRGGGSLSLASLPPYRTAAGSFEGAVSETAALPKSGVELSGAVLPFCGKASVAGLVTNPVWRVSLQVPEVGIASRQAAVAWRAVAGAATEIQYSANRFSLEGDLWLREAAMTAGSSGKVGRVEAGLEKLNAHVGVSEASPADLSNLLVRVCLDARNGWGRTGDKRVTLAGAEASVPFDWSLARGLTFGAGARLTWKDLESEGVRVFPEVLTLRTEGGCAEAAFGVKVGGSRFCATARARVPLSDPRHCTIDVAVPETELTPDDSLAARLKRIDSAVVATGRLAVEARVRFLGTQPHVLGRIRFSDGTLSRDRLEISGLSADVAFEGGLGLRTIERPTVTFSRVKAGNIGLGKGRVEFQITPDEVFVDRLEVDWCRGSLNAYSVHLDPKNPKANVIVYADRVDLGEALMTVMPFKGKMEGVLYGRFPVGIEGTRVKLSTGYLYSLPGQGGVLRLEDPVHMRSLLERAGVTGDVQQPLSKALSDMDFTAIRMELEPKGEGDAVFRIKLDGKSNFKEWPAPVALNLNLHGPLEELLNLGLSVSRK